jgi:ParB family chromosome partitioning protein
MDELVRSVQSHGVLEPLLIRRTGEGYELVAGERRLRAAQRAGIKDVPAIIVDLDDKQSLEIALIENLQREDLNPIDEARAYQMLVDAFGRTHDDIATQVGKDRSTVSNLLRLLRLPNEVLVHLEAHALSVGHARSLLGLESIEEQVTWGRKIVDEQWSVRETERRLAERAREMAESPNVTRMQKSPGSPSPMRDPHLGRVEEAIRRRVGTEVRLHLNRSGRGRLELVFADREDLERILELLEVQVH